MMGSQSFHTWGDWGLIQQSKAIDPPEVQSYHVQIPGRDGLLNLTKAISGRVCYNNRKVTFKYFKHGEVSQLKNLIETLYILHGETARIIDDDDPSFYYEGELAVSAEFHHNYVFIEIAVDAQPFATANRETIKTFTASSSTKTATLTVQCRPVIPTIILTGEMTLTFGDWSAKLSEGTYTTDNIYLQTGANSLKYKGSGTLTVTWREVKI